MKKESIFKNPAIIGSLVESLLTRDPSKQVGKTVVQKMMYLLSREGAVNFDYSMYHYGPYSAEVAGELNFAESAGIVEMKWVDEQGYFIKKGRNLTRFSSLITGDQKKAVDKLVDTHVQFNATELSIITTAFFLKDNFKVPDARLAKVVHDLKPNHDLRFIEEKLREAGAIKN